MRLHELAKELGIAANSLIKLLQDEGFDIKGPLNILGDEEIKTARTKLAKPKPVAEPKPQAKQQAPATKKKVFIRKTTTQDPRSKPRTSAQLSTQARPAQIPPKRLTAVPAKPGTAPVIKKKPRPKPEVPVEEPMVEVAKTEVAETPVPEVITEKPQKPITREKTPEVEAKPVETKKAPPQQQQRQQERPQQQRPQQPSQQQRRDERPRQRDDFKQRDQRQSSQQQQRPPQQRQGGPSQQRQGGQSQQRQGGPSQQRQGGPQQRQGGPSQQRPGSPQQRQGPPRDDQRRRPQDFKSDKPKFSKEDAMRAARDKRRAPGNRFPQPQGPGTAVDDRRDGGKPQAGYPDARKKRKKGGNEVPKGRDTRERAKEAPKDIILEGEALNLGVQKLKGSFKASIDSGSAVKGKRKKKILPQDKKRPKVMKTSKRDESEYGGRAALVKRHKKRKQFDTTHDMYSLKIEAHKKVRVTDHMTIKDLSAVTGVKSPTILKFLLDELKVIANINQVIDIDIAGLVLEHLGYEYEVIKKEVEDYLKKTDDREEDLVRRSPVVTVLGHVDHGKTKLLDTIRKTNVAGQEAGGITQAIGAYQASYNGRMITFIDTPGHEAFTAMRARGAKVTDVAILVVACDDGVQPQTLEAIDHAKSAGLEIIVALNKVDLETSDPERVKAQLSEVGLVPEEWGGNTVMVPISAKFNRGIDELLELVLLQADLLDLKANPNALAEGTIIEARIDRGKGPVATVLIQRGTLHVGDYVVVGCSYGRIRAMQNELGKEQTEARPSVPVEIFGLSDVPQAGDILNQVETEKIAKEIYDKRCLDRRQERIRAVNKISLDELYQKIQAGEAKELNLIIKADMQGSIEAIIHALMQLDQNDVQIKFIHSSVGNVKESDIMLAIASKSIIIAFNVVVSAEMKKLAHMEGVDIRAYNIIYKAVEDVEKAMKGLLEPEFEEHIIGTAQIRAIFKKAKGTIIAGAIVQSGKMKRGGDIRILRNGEVIWKGKLNSLKRFTDDAREVDAGMECGLALDSITDLAEGDIIEEFEMVEKPRL